MVTSYIPCDFCGANSYYFHSNGAVMEVPLVMFKYHGSNICLNCRKKKLEESGYAKEAEKTHETD